MDLYGLIHFYILTVCAFDLIIYVPMDTNLSEMVRHSGTLVDVDKQKYTKLTGKNSFSLMRFICSLNATLPLRTRYFILLVKC